MCCQCVAGVLMSFDCLCLCLSLNVVSIYMYSRRIRTPIERVLNMWVRTRLPSPRPSYYTRNLSLPPSLPPPLPSSLSLSLARSRARSLSRSLSLSLARSLARSVSLPLLSLFLTRLSLSHPPFSLQHTNPHMCVYTHTHTHLLTAPPTAT